MLANINAGDSEMRELAEQRAAAARDWLVEYGGIPSERIFVLEPKVEAEARCTRNLAARWNFRSDDSPVPRKN